MCLSCTLLRWKLKGGKMTHTTSRPYSGLGHLGNTRPGLSKIWLKYAFYLLTNFWKQTYGKVFVLCQHSTTLHTRLQHSTTQPPVLLVFFLLNAGMCQCTGRRPVRHWCSTADRQEGGGEEVHLDLPLPLLLNIMGGGAEHQIRQSTDQGDDSFAHNNWYNSRPEWLSSVLARNFKNLTWHMVMHCGDLIYRDIERIGRWQWEPW